ncbi:MAG: protein kinase [Planctomycetia bacterium]|nr:protein kinase [Planctomycetia bacterium]
MNALATCPDAKLLQAFRLGELSGPESAAVADHLRACAACGARGADELPAQQPLTADPDPTRGLGPAPLHETQAGVPVPPRPAAGAGRAYSFLQPPEKPGEIGRLGSFRVLRPLGEGGMGMVFDAEEITLRRRVALKVLKPELRGQADILQRFILEARALAALKHENLVTIHQAGQEHGTFYLAMELLAGESLAAWMARTGPAPLRDVLRLGREIAAGLTAIHGRRLVHRDLKPSNIWLEAPKGQVKILDFGLVRRVQEEAPLTQMGIVLGTPAFMSPEQARGDRVDGRSDLFNLGIILYALCTSVKPFRGDSKLEVLTAIAADQPQNILELAPATPRPLVELIMRLLAKKPEGRPASAEQVIEVLQRLERAPRAVQPAPVPVPEPVRAPEAAPAALPKLEHAPRPRRQRPAPSPRLSMPVILLSCLAVLGLLALGLAIYSLASGPSSTPPRPTQVAVVPPKATVRTPPPPTEAKQPAKVDPQPKVVEPPPLPEPKVEPPPEPEPVRIYLDELKPSAAENWPVFKNPRVVQPPKFDRLMVKGEPLPHGIYMHPPPLLLGRYTSISYKLDKKYAVFRTGVSLLDAAPAGCSPVFFAVHGDKKLLHECKPVATQHDAQLFGLSVKGVDVLTLSVTTKGADIRGALAVWINPSLQE